MTDLPAKYQRLATEYSKLRSQIPVLKKAVIDEKSVQETLKEDLKEKEQTVRKCSQEIDSLTFRNQQLSKRVLFLQDELDSVNNQKKKNKNKEDSNDFVNSHKTDSVLGEELRSKIEENARLHKMVSEAGAEYEERIHALEGRISKYEFESSSHQQSLTNLVQTHTNQMDKLIEDKAALEVKLQSVESELKNASLVMQSSNLSHSDVLNDLRKKLENAERIIDSNLPFIDNRHKHLNALNLPTHDRKHQSKVKEVTQQAVSYVRDLMAALSNFYTYTEQRTKIIINESTEVDNSVNRRFCDYLHTNAIFTKPVFESLERFSESLRDDHLITLDTAVDLQDFGNRFHDLVVFMEKLLPYQKLSLQEESQVSSCPESLQKKNADLTDAFQNLVVIFLQIDTYLKIIASQSLAARNPKQQSNRDAVFKEFTAHMSKLYEVSRALSKLYSAKVSLEHQLPTATQKLKTTDECVVSSLVSLVSASGKLSAFLVSNKEFFTQDAGYRTRGCSTVSSSVVTTDKLHLNPAVNLYRKQTLAYLSTISVPVSESVPYKTALQNRRILLSSSESRDSLAHQLHSVQTQLSDLVQEKEHFLLEMQLLKIKYEKEIEKNEDLEKKVHSLGSGIVDSIQANVDHDNSSLSNTNVSSEPLKQLGSVDVVPAKSDMDAREALIKGHFSKRVSELTTSLQLADSKAVNFHAEVRALHKRLQLAERSKEQSQEEKNVACNTLAQLTDELKTTTRSYDGQLSLMSDHLAEMNDKLVSQKEEIDELKIQLAAAKGNKKLIPLLKK